MLKAQILDRMLQAYRIGDANGEYPIFDPAGSKLYPGRWNSSSSPMIYTSEHYSTAMLEKLIHGSGKMPRNQHYIVITIPNGVTYETVSLHGLRGWDDPSGVVSRHYGETWYRERRSLILMVPSVVARIEMNILINPDHPDFSRITHGLHQPVWWDERLYPETDTGLA
jgi:RES domain-containing protein